MAGYFERAFWNQYARSYDNLAKHFRPYQDLVTEVCDHVDRIGGGRSLRILDAGCGTGNYSWELARCGHEVVGIDNSPAMLARAEAKREVLPVKIQFLRHDLTEPLPFAVDEFDAVVSAMVLYTLKQPREFLAELRRVVRSGGSAVLVTMQERARLACSIREVTQASGPRHAAYVTYRLAFVGVANLVINSRHTAGEYHILTPKQLASLIDSCGWSTVMAGTTYTCGTGSLVVATRGSDK